MAIQFIIWGAVAIGSALGIGGCTPMGGGGGYKNKDAGDEADATPSWVDTANPPPPDAPIYTEDGYVPAEDTGNNPDAYVPPVENNDKDKDGFPLCPANVTDELKKICDCDDTRNYVYPGTFQRINGMDTNCDGKLDVDVSQDAMAFVGEQGKINQYPGDQAGVDSIATGDFNGDGYSDLAVAAFQHSTQPDYREGKIYMYFGGPDKFKPGQKLQLKDADTTIIGGGGWEIGSSLASIDLDNDKKEDLLFMGGFNNGQCGGTCGDGTGEGLVNGIIIMYGRNNWNKAYSFYDIDAYSEQALKKNNVAVVGFPAILEKQGDNFRTIQKTLKGGSNGIAVGYSIVPRVDIIPAKKYEGIQDINNVLESKIFDSTFGSTIGVRNQYAVDDLNADGFADILVANQIDLQHAQTGFLRFIFGAADLPKEIDIKNLKNIPGLKYFTMTGKAKGAGAGAVVNMADLDGDGKCEISVLANGEPDTTSLYTLYADQILSAMAGTHPNVNMPNGGNIVLDGDVYLLGGKSITGDLSNSAFALGGLTVTDPNNSGINKLLTSSWFYSSKSSVGHIIDMALLKNEPQNDFKASEASKQLVTGPIVYLGDSVVGKFDFNGDGAQDAAYVDGSGDNGKGITYLLLGGQ